MGVTAGKFLAKNIMAVQAELGWDRSRMLKRLKISRSTFSRWRNGLRNPNVQNYIKIQKQLNKLRRS